MQSPFKDWKCHSEVASPSPDKLIVSALSLPDAATTEEFDRVTSDRSGLCSYDSLSRFQKFCDEGNVLPHIRLNPIIDQQEIE
jgi:hypothetical protein